MTKSYPTPAEIKITREMILKVCPFNYSDVSDDVSEYVLNKIADEKLEPFEAGNSLHCWSHDHIIDGKHYQIIGTIGDDSSPPLVQLVTPNR